jgi:hypothetical protein
MMRRSTGFDTGQTWRQLLEERQDIPAFQLPASRSLVSGFHEFDARLQHAPPGSLGFRVKHQVKFLDGLYQPVKPQIIKFRLYVQVRSAEVSKNYSKVI